MKIYLLLEVIDSHGRQTEEEIISVSDNKKFILDKAEKLTAKEVRDRVAWKDTIYWIHTFNSRTGKRISEVQIYPKEK